MALSTMQEIFVHKIVDQHAQKSIRTVQTTNFHRLNTVIVQSRIIKIIGTNFTFGRVTRFGYIIDMECTFLESSRRFLTGGS